MTRVGPGSRTAGLRLDLALRPFPHRAHSRAGNQLRVLDGHRRAGPRHQTIRIGQMVTCNNYRNPALLAKIASTVDVMSHGRLDFGIGAGWYEDEYNAYGYPFPDGPERLRHAGRSAANHQGDVDRGLRHLRGQVLPGARRDQRAEGRAETPSADLDRRRRREGHAQTRRASTATPATSPAASTRSLPPQVRRGARTLRHAWAATTTASSSAPRSSPSCWSRAKWPAPRRSPRPYRDGKSLEEVRKGSFWGTPQSCRILRALDGCGCRYFIFYVYEAANWTVCACSPAMCCLPCVGIRPQRPQRPQSINSLWPSANKKGPPRHGEALQCKLVAARAARVAARGRRGGRSGRAC